MHGYDGVELRGANEVLRDRTVRCLLFEYHKLPPWRLMSLQEVVSTLEEFGYDCYLQGADRLWKLTG